MKYQKRGRHLKGPGLLLCLLGFAACASGEGPQATSDLSAPDAGNQNQLTVESCVGTPIGLIETSLGAIGYAGGSLQGEGKHQVQEGCLTELNLRFERVEGCPLDLTLESVDGAWTLREGALSLDAGCGLEGVEDSYGTYVLESAGATGALVGPQVVSSEDEAACVNATSLSLMGKATFKNGTQVLDVTLNELQLSGEIFSTRLGESSCPSEAQSCVDALCGTDEYGVKCGSCDIGYDCDAGQCALNSCPPQAPFSTHAYDSLADLTVYDCDGEPVQLHDLCGAPVGFFNLLAGW